MKVGLNATCLNDRASGAKQRFLGIYRELVALLPEVQFVVYEPCDCEVGKWFSGAPNVTAVRTPIPSEGRFSKALHGFGYWRKELSRQSFDVLEGFNLPFVVAHGAANIITIHDLRGMQPEAGLLESVVFRLVLRKALRTASLVITVSESMKRDLKLFDAQANVAVVYNGLGDRERVPPSSADLELFKQRFCLQEGFILSVGHIEPRKNYSRLVDAVAQLAGEGFTQTLVVIGNNNGERAMLEAHIAGSGIKDRVYLLSGLSDVEVRCAYALCGLFVFPSVYEGFGIPILEAMAAGRPMVLSDIAVFREITQDQGIYFPPADCEAMAAAMRQVLTHPGDRVRLVEYGCARVRDFSYRHLAEQLLSLYRSIHAR